MNKKSFFFELFSVCRQGFSKGPFEKGGTVKLFFVWKKSYKRSKQACCLTCLPRHQLSRKGFFWFRNCCSPVAPITATPKSKRFGIIGSAIWWLQFDGAGACGSLIPRTHGALPCAVTRSTVRENYRLYGHRWVLPQVCRHSHVII